MANQIPIKVMCDGSGNTCGLAQFTSSDSVAIASGGTGLNSQGICEFVQPGLYAVGCQVTYLGICAGKADTGVGHDNTYVGHSAGTAVTTGCQHTIIGSQAGKAITTCSGTVAIGYNAGLAQTFGDFNTLIGTAGGAAITTASSNTVVGYHAATATICSNNIAIGTCAMVANTQGQDNVAIGVKAGATQVAAGCNNVFVGSNAGAVSLCRDNVSIGSYAGKAATTGGGNVMIGACVGYGVVGGASNVYIGDKAGLVNTSGNANVFIGNCAGCATTGSCCLIIGNGSCDLITGDFNGGKVGIGTSSQTATLTLNGTYSSGANGPNIEFFGTATDAYPSMQILNFSHDDQSINFDNYYDGVWKSSDAGSNFQIRKGADKLTLRYDSGIASGSTLTWNTGFVMDTSGKIGIANDDPADYVDASGALLVVGCTGTVSGVSIISSGNGRLNFGDGAGDPDQWQGVIQYANSTDTMSFSTKNCEALRINDEGVLGVKTVPTGGWHTDHGVIQIGTGALWVDPHDESAASNMVFLSNNLYRDSADEWRAIVTDEATRYYQYGGEHYFDTAASTSAGSAVSFTNRLKIDSDGIITTPSQPAFMANRNAGGCANNATGDGTHRC